MPDARQAFLREGIAAFGEAGIEKILDKLHDGLTLGAEQLGIAGQVGAVSLQIVTDVPERYKDINVWGKHTTGDITVALNATAPVQAVLDDAKRVGVHEVAHKAHFLHPSAGKDWGQRNAFSLLIKEGIATHVEFALIDEDYWPPNLLNTSQLIRERLDDVLIRALFGTAVEDAAAALFAEGAEIDKYMIGGYVVGLMAVTKELGLRDLLGVSFDEFRKFAQTEL